MPGFSRHARPSVQGEDDWRSRWDSNPRRACALYGVQDRCLQPLGHGSITVIWLVDLDSNQSFGGQNPVFYHQTTLQFGGCGRIRTCEPPFQGYPLSKRAVSAAHPRIRILAGGPGLEPGSRDSESPVLPLNYPPITGGEGRIRTCASVETSCFRGRRFQPLTHFSNLAETGGFEPPRPFRDYPCSRRAPSTARPRFRSPKAKARLNRRRAFAKLERDVMVSSCLRSHVRNPRRRNRAR